jgi:hypothetical protein
MPSLGPQTPVIGRAGCGEWASARRRACGVHPRFVRLRFAFDDEVALLCFAGHGRIEMIGDHLLTSDVQRGDDVARFAQVSWANSRSMRFLDSDA